jgi:hypothetical protein
LGESGLEDIIFGIFFNNFVMGNVYFHPCIEIRFNEGVITIYLNLRSAFEGVGVFGQIDVIAFVRKEEHSGIKGPYNF